MGKGTLLGQIFIVCWCLFLRGELCAARKKPLLVCAPEMSGCLGVWMNCGESRVTIYMCVDTCASRWFILWSSIYIWTLLLYTQVGVISWIGRTASYWQGQIPWLERTGLIQMLVILSLPRTIILETYSPHGKIGLEELLHASVNTHSLPLVQLCFAILIRYALALAGS